MGRRAWASSTIWGDVALIFRLPHAIGSLKTLLMHEWQRDSVGVAAQRHAIAHSQGQTLFQAAYGCSLASRPAQILSAAPIASASRNTP